MKTIQGKANSIKPIIIGTFQTQSTRNKSNVNKFSQKKSRLKSNIFKLSQLQSKSNVIQGQNKLKCNSYQVL
jgi:hypothetical protein